jgi:DNA replication protein DnaC
MSQDDERLETNRAEPAPFDFPIECQPAKDDGIIRGRKSEEEVQRDIAESYRRQRETIADRKVPADYMTKDDRNRKGVNWQAFDAVQAWDGKLSIICKGKSQLGKSRAVYRMLHKQYVENERSFIALDERQILLQISDAFGEKGLLALDRKWMSADILFFDDIDKANFTDGVTGRNAMSLVFGVIKARMAERKVTILGYNTSISAIFKPAGDHVAESLIERMKQPDRWMIVNFDEFSE